MSIPFVKTVCKAMENIASLRLAEKWDNVGIPTVGLGTTFLISITRVLLAPFEETSSRSLDHQVLTPSVVEECISLEAAVIVSYRPPIFRPLQSLTLQPAASLASPLCGRGYLSPHSALDSTLGGVNDWLAMGLGKGQVSALVGEMLDVKGKSECAEGRLVVLDEPLPVNQLVDRVKKHLGLSQVPVAYPSSSGNVRTVAICAGSGTSMLVGHDADLYLTGEMSHHDVLASVPAGKHVILCGHTNTERGFLPVLA
ncbi:NGG1 interacting factor 3-like protein [Armillaria fumosa]|nr:NGG1 interacting factor 3-like protein [Armillaria fumosa]